VSPAQRLLIAAIVLATGALGFGAGRSLLRPSGGTSQPIAFDHLKHTGELEIACDQCHANYTEGEHAGLPALSTCLDCHAEPLTESPDEQRIRDLAETGQDDVFRKLFHLPDHTFYSHRRHAVIGELACATCHGSIAETTVPPTRPLVHITMDFCVDCHERGGVSTDCTRCHR